jgi:hypothetical protein
MFRLTPLGEEDFRTQYHRCNRYRRLADHYARWHAGKDDVRLRRVHPRLMSFVRFAAAEADQMDLILGAAAVGRSLGRCASRHSDSRPDDAGELVEQSSQH